MFNNKFTKVDPVVDAVLKVLESYDDDEDDDVKRADAELRRMKAKPIEADKGTDPDKEIGKLAKKTPKEVDEELKGAQHKLDVAEPKGKLTAADFKKLRKEELEQIDELSKKTLGSYIKKSTLDARKHSEIAGQHDLGNWGKFSKAIDKAEKRQKGVNLAADKLAKEELEQIDEISGELATRYKKKALGGKSYDDDSWNELSRKRQKGIGLANRKVTQSLHPHNPEKHAKVPVTWKEESELSEKTLTPAESKKKEEIVKSMKKGAKGFKERYGKRAKEVMYATATKQAKRVAEEVEQIDELDSTTLSNYSQKARKDKNQSGKDIERLVHDKGSKKNLASNLSKLGRKIYNRETGLERAKTRLNKEKIDHKPKDSTDNKDIHDTLMKHGFSKGKTYRQKDGNLKNATSPNGHVHETHRAVTDYHHPKLGIVSVGHDNDINSMKWARHNKPNENRNHVLVGARQNTRGTFFNREGDTSGRTDTELHKHLNKLRTGKHTALHGMHDKNYDDLSWANLDHRTHSEEVELSESYGDMSHAAKELVLHADNHQHLYHSSHQPIMNNLRKKMKKGEYHPEKAKKLWAYHADRAAQSYAKEHGDGKPWHKMFSTADRKAAASHWEDMHRHELNESKGPTSDYGLETFATNPTNESTPLNKAKIVAKAALAKVKNEMLGKAGATSEEIDPRIKTTDTLNGRMKGGKDDDVGPGADGKSTKVKFIPGPK